tara:strand:- start:8 stop:205 length:198 start_codon:yes stop_codon:yes gene_type:complete
MTNILKVVNDKVTLCCGRDKSCPQVSFNEDNQVTIVDDYGNEVVMEKDQAKLIDQALKELEKSKS